MSITEENNRKKKWPKRVVRCQRITIEQKNATKGHQV
jgi:hypothetical protein